MQVGINILLWTDSPGEAHVPLFRRIKGWGFDGAELPIFDPGGAPWTVLGKALDDVGLRRTAVTVVPADANPASDDARVRIAAADRLKRVIDAAKVLGAEALCGPFCSPVGVHVGRGPSEEEWKRCIDVMRMVAEHGRSAGVRLGVEALNRFETYMPNCMADAAWLVDQVGVEGFGILYDTFHAHIEEKSAAAAVRTAWRRIELVHVSENDRSTPGEGQVNWRETFGALRDGGYDGWFVIEAFGQALPAIAAATCIWRQMFPSEEHLARQGLRFIRKAWEEAGGR